MSKKHKEAIQKQFARTVELFSKTCVRDTPEIQAEKVAFARPQPGDLSLDVACGPGELVLGLAPRVKFARGVDLTLEMLRQAGEFRGQRQVPNACFDLGEVECLPYPDTSFDLVSCQCSIHHFEKPRIAVQEMLRVMKPQGRMMVIDTLAPEIDSKFELHNRIERVRDPSHTQSLRLTTFLQWFDELGLEIARQALKRRERSFNQWMRRAGLEPKHKRYVEARTLLENSLANDAAGFSPRRDADDFVITHHEAMFLLTRRQEG